MKEFEEINIEYNQVIKLIMLLLNNMKEFEEINIEHNKTSRA